MSEHLHFQPMSAPEASLVFAPFSEHREVFAGQNILVIGGSDAHGVSMAVASAEYLERRGATVQTYAGSPVIRDGHGATHPSAFWQKTIDQLEVNGFDRVVIADIPLDAREMKNAPKDLSAGFLRPSEKSLIKLAQRLTMDRIERGEQKLDYPVIYLDHHSAKLTQTPVVYDQHDLSQVQTKLVRHGVAVRVAYSAYSCRLGSEHSRAARIGAVADRETEVLPVTEAELELARGLDIAVKPDPNDRRPKDPGEDLHAWEDRAEARLAEALRRLHTHDWEYFRGQSADHPPKVMPTLSGFGHIALIDTQGLTDSFRVLHDMEESLTAMGPATTPYGMAILRNVKDTKMGRPDADLITIIRHWTQETYLNVDKVVRRALGDAFVDSGNIYGLSNVQTLRLPVDAENTAQIAVRLLEAFAGTELPDFSKVRSVVMCGDPNSGKSVYSAILREALKNLGVRVSHLDLDKAAPTPDWYLEAEIGFASAQVERAAGRLSENALETAREKLDQAAAARRALKRPWSIGLAQEAKDELLAEAQKDGVDFVIGDIGGGRIFRDPETQKITRIQRLTAENARILEGADAVIIVSNNQAGMDQWRQLIESGADPETGVRIQRDTPIQIIGMYQSVLEGSVQKTAHGEAGVVTNLDRTKAERIYNPAILTTAMFVKRAIEKRKQ